MIKRFLAFLLAFLMGFTSLAGQISVTSATSVIATGSAPDAYSNSIGEGLTWEIKNGSCLTISGAGDLDSFTSQNPAPWQSYADRVTSVVLSEGITSVGWYAFEGLNRVKTVTLPESLTYIGRYAFTDCSSLSLISIPAGMIWIDSLAFSGCSGLEAYDVSADNLYYASSEGILYDKDLTELILCPAKKTGSVKIPEGVEEIGSYAFAGCASLEEILLPESMEYIGTEGFAGCSSLENFTVTKNVYYIGDRAFRNCTSLTSLSVSADSTVYSSVDGVLYTKTGSGLLCFPCGKSGSYSVPEGTSYIGWYAFENATGLGSVILPESLVTIWTGAFLNCDGLSSITLPAGVTAVKMGAFENCNSLVSVDCRGKLTEIDWDVFLNCTKLRSITLPDSVETIGRSAFSGCSALEHITFGTALTSIEQEAFCGCSSLASVDIPDSVTKLGSSAFLGCSSLEKITLGSGISSLPGYVFSFCEKLENITIPGNVLSIGERAFESCSLLQTVTMEKGVQEIGDYAFGFCSALTKVVLPSGLQSLQEDPFCGCTSLESFTLSEKSDYYSLSDGILYNKAMTTLVRCPQGKSGGVIVPESVVSLENYAFCGCEKITSVTFEGHPSSIGIATDSGVSDTVFADVSCPVYYTPEDGWTAAELANYGGELTWTASHTHTPGEAVQENVVPATCAVAGSYDEVVYCTVCGAELSRTAKALEKTAHTPGQLQRENEVPATCAVAGSYNEVVYCTVCGAEISRTAKTLEKTAHTPGEMQRENEVSATCAIAGSYDEVVYCTVCGAEISRTAKTLEKTAHTPGEMQRENEVSATCAVAGSYDEVIYCTVCGAEISRTTKTVEKTAHTYGNWEVDTPATYATTGTEIRKCTVCGETLETREIAMLTLSIPQITKTENTATGVKLTWGKVDGATKYRVYYKLSSTSKWSKSDTTATFATVTDLNSGESYLFSVKAYADGTWSDNTISSPFTYCAMPTVSKTENTSTGVKLTWGKIDGATKYRVYYKLSTASKYTTFKDVTGNSVTVTGLTAGKSYVFTVKAYNGSSWSANKATSAVVYRPVPTVSKLTNAAKGITVTWTKISGATKYALYFKVSGASSWTRFSNTLTANSATVTGLTSGKSYVFTVKAYVGGGWSTNVSSSAIVRVNAVTLSGLTNSSSKTMKATWKKDTTLTGYQIQYSLKSDFSDAKTVTVKSNTTVSQTIKSLTKGKTYYVRIRGYKTVSKATTYGAWSASKSVKISK